ncbi:malonate--CoA ligase ACSF3, mitochondrial-like [Aplochiton taeniatus]
MLSRVVRHCVIRCSAPLSLPVVDCTPFYCETAGRLLPGNVVLRRAYVTSSSARQTIAALAWDLRPGPVFTKAPAYGAKLAIIDSGGNHSYKQLYGNSLGLARRIRAALHSDPGADLEGKRISFLCANDASYTVAQWAAWMCGGTAVPLYRKHPPSELEYVITDSQSSLLVAGHGYADTLEPLAQRLGLPCLALPPTSSLEEEGTDGTAGAQGEGAAAGITDWVERPAMIIYTSGTTGRPKGVLHTHSTLQAMCIKAGDGSLSKECFSLTHLFAHLLSSIIGYQL